MSQNVHTIDRTGADGAVLANSTSPLLADKYTKIKFITNGAIATITGSKLDTNGITLSGITWPAGFTLEGPFTAATFGSGTVVAYKE